MLSHKPLRRCSYYKAVVDEHNLNNCRYAAFLKSSTKIKADLSSIPPTKGAVDQHTFRNVSVLAPLMETKRPPVGVVRKFGEEVPAQVSFSSSDRSSK
ncbi:hypothetical protein AVEN_96501-1 [Araneus ventricosus]|uniref:Uncharacterized protein n=1 Tax=Araneus ventricosus TaxID=182803 RepID=A0A4Y2CX64_ARAVE|nr:hypothetical protein AVEN_96501-1 [Araneus ventricosus]